VVLMPAALPGCSDAPLSAVDGWSGPPESERDIRRIVLSYAILAPNPHNKQPWIVRFTGPRSLELFVDPERLLPETDPPYRQIHIGQGTFLENLVLAAQAHGHRAVVRYFPAGMYGNQALEPKPVAAIELVPDAALVKDPLFEAILARQTNRRAYEATALRADELRGIQGAYDTSEYPLSVLTAAPRREALAEMLEQAMRVETSNRRRDLETIAMFRFNDREIEAYRDGFGLAQSGMGPFMRWMAETFFLSRESTEADPSAFGKEAVTMTGRQARSAAAFAWISSIGNTRLDQVKVGRAYERVNLTATRLGLAMHPLSQVLQEYADMSELQRAFLQALEIPPGHTVQMLFRLGRAERTPHSPRRPPDALLRTST
jgi:hypothetical protein